MTYEFESLEVGRLESGKRCIVVRFVQRDEKDWPKMQMFAHVIPDFADINQVGIALHNLADMCHNFRETK